MAKALVNDNKNFKLDGAAQTLCDYVKLLKVRFKDMPDQKIKKSKADRKLKVS